MRIGLFGGTFNPPHDAHRAASLIALRRLGLDHVWWLVTPGNPLKDTRGLAAARRPHRGGGRSPPSRASTSPVSRPRIGTRYTSDTVALSEARTARRCDFVWIMGADNLRSFHRWENWRDIAAMRADRGGRPARPEPLATGGTAATGARALPHPGSGGAVAGRPRAAGLGLPARPEIAAVVDRVAGRPAAVAKPPLKMGNNTGASECDRLKPLTGHAYLNRGAESRGDAAVKEAKGKDPCPHLQSLGLARRLSRARTGLRGAT